MAADPLAPCTRCHAAPKWSADAKTLHCAGCRDDLLRRPASRVTPEQGEQIARLAGTRTRGEIALALGLHQGQVNRWLREQGLRSNARDYPQEVVDAVCLAYGVLGKVRTQELFPEVRVRSIYERYYQGPPRQERWTGDQILEAVRMGGLVSHTAQAVYFGRPNAFGGSIESLWTKRLRTAARDVHGLGARLAWELCGPGVPATLVSQQVMPGPRLVVLWLDMVAHLKADVPPEVRGMVETLAGFQAWLFGHGDSGRVRRFIREREQCGRSSRVSGQSSQRGTGAGHNGAE